MRVTVQFESLEEFQKYMVPTAADPAPAAEPAPAAPDEDNEELRLEVRRTLAKLNKKVKGNPAKGLVRELGSETLTDLPAAKLPELLEKAKEALENAE